MTFELDVLRRLAEVPGVAAIKESSWSPARFAESAAAFAGDRHDVALLSGQDSFILDSLLAGADGAMLAAAATDAGAFATMWAQRGTAGAAEIQAALDPYLEGLFAPPLRDFRARLKAMLARDGAIAAATVRAPLQQIGAGEADALHERAGGGPGAHRKPGLGLVGGPGERGDGPAGADEVGPHGGLGPVGVAVGQRLEDRAVLLAGLRALVEPLDVEPDVRLGLLAEPLDQLEQARPHRRLVDGVVELGVQPHPGVDLLLVSHRGEDLPQPLEVVGRQRLAGVARCDTLERGPDLVDLLDLGRG